MLRLVLALAAAAALLPRPAFAADLESLLRLHYQAVNRADVAAVVDSFTGDAVLIRGTCTVQLPCRGKAEIQRQVQTETGNKVSFGVLSSRVAGDTVTARVEWWNINVPNAGVQRVVRIATAVFTGEKISRYSEDLDLSDAQSAEFAKFQRMTDLTNSFLTALQRGAVDEALSRFTDDATLSGLGSCTLECSGKTAIRAELEREATDHVAIAAGGAGSKVSGDVLTSVRQWRADSVRTAGADRILIGITLTARGTQIASLRLDPVLEDPQTRAFIMTQASAPARLPNTGGDPAAAWVLAGAGLVLLRLGFKLR